MQTTRHQPFRLLRGGRVVCIDTENRIFTLGGRGRAEIGGVIGIPTPYRLLHRLLYRFALRDRGRREGARSGGRVLDDPAPLLGRCRTVERRRPICSRRCTVGSRAIRAGEKRQRRSRQRGDVVAAELVAAFHWEELPEAGSQDVCLSGGGAISTIAMRPLPSRDSSSEIESLIDRLVHIYAQGQAARELLSVGQRRTHRRGIGRALWSITSRRRTSTCKPPQANGAETGRGATARRDPPGAPPDRRGGRRHRRHFGVVDVFG
jgi:hypothetical protein